MTVDAYMSQWIKDHPGPWYQCPICNGWRMTTNPKGHCPLCPPPVRERNRARSWERRGAGDDQGHMAGPYGHEDNE